MSRLVSLASKTIFPSSKATGAYVEHFRASYSQQPAHRYQIIYKSSHKSAVAKISSSNRDSDLIAPPTATCSLRKFSNDSKTHDPAPKETGGNKTYFPSYYSGRIPEISWTEFVNFVHNGDITRVTINSDRNRILVHHQYSLLPSRLSATDVSTVADFESRLRGAERFLGKQPEDAIPVIHEKDLPFGSRVIVSLVGIPIILTTLAIGLTIWLVVGVLALTVSLLFVSFALFLKSNLTLEEDMNWDDW